ncbi:hypothetical protein TK1357 [Thermococcus kodakarensis KOD1]|uniref:Uncharacterized protein n=1 Tax=Thermococcus kodakarensis (strain ATCC BAA-918 / JCM 12380 / KOD1) TaxID=69014 RepID=Q5JGW5_THEKO|nr:hypothetical protein [Thermococcus kodakarensis]WCN27336.1 hypothetical protein POG15_06895 [Thermococcus kodakarensis]WCN29625.1 hypothetical protein POG21_06890 [Thermococcus kodakarensis]BAD85546.1 hypothetical protein TK1357 [Thermococcus kodakarensis KOD1]
MSEEAVAQEVVLDEKDITSLVEDVDKDLEEVEELLNEGEAEVEEVAGTSGLMTEEEFNARIDEFQEKDHSLTIFANFYVKNLERKAREQGLDVDFSLWWDVGRPSFNAGLWYMEKVEGQSLQVSGKFGLLVGAGSLLLLTWMYRSALKKKGKEKADKGPAAGGEKRTGEPEKPVKTEAEALREKAKPKEPEPPKSELLNKIQKNLGS